MDSIRNLFPVVENWTYLNNAANGPEPLPVLGAIEEYLRACSTQGTVMEDEWKFKPAFIRENVAKLLNCDSSSIAFLPNVSAAINVVAGGLKWNHGDNVVVTQDQFPANVYPWLFQPGVEVRYAQWQKNGLVDSVRTKIDKKTRVVAVSWVEFYTGTRHNLADLSILCKERDIILVVDAIQGLGAIPFPQDTGADLVAFGCQKWLLGPDGQGGAYFNPNLLDALQPKVYSWRSIENFMDFDNPRVKLKSGADRLEGGTQNWSGVFGMGAAIELVLDLGIHQIASKIETLTEQLLDGLKSLPVDVLTPEKFQQRAGIVTFIPKKIDSEILRKKLLAKKIVVSARRNALRVSPHFYNTKDDIKIFLETLRQNIF